jgi:ssDNA-binding Zn-finger/Zn-ribbon topoisomerase 1
MRHRIPIEEIKRRLNEDGDKLSRVQRRSYELILAGKCVECTGPLEEWRLKKNHRRCDGCASYHSARTNLYNKEKRSKANV